MPSFSLHANINNSAGPVKRFAFFLKKKEGGGDKTATLSPTHALFRHGFAGHAIAGVHVECEYLIRVPGPRLSPKSCSC